MFYMDVTLFKHADKSKQLIKQKIKNCLRLAKTRKKTLKKENIIN